MLSRPSDAGAAWTLRSQHLGGYLASAQLEVSETKGGEGQVPGLRARGTSERDDVKHPAIPWFIHAAAAGPGTSDAEEGYVSKDIAKWLESSAYVPLACNQAGVGTAGGSSELMRRPFGGDVRARRCAQGPLIDGTSRGRTECRRRVLSPDGEHGQWTR